MKGAFLLANPDSDSHNPIFVSPFHLSESEMRFESKESISSRSRAMLLGNSSWCPTDRTPQVRVVLLFEFVFKRIFPWDRNEIGLN